MLFQSLKTYPCLQIYFDVGERTVKIDMANRTLVGGNRFRMNTADENLSTKPEFPAKTTVESSPRTSKQTAPNVTMRL